MPSLRYNNASPNNKNKTVHNSNSNNAINARRHHSKIKNLKYRLSTFDGTSQPACNREVSYTCPHPHTPNETTGQGFYTQNLSVQHTQTCRVPHLDTPFNSSNKPSVSTHTAPIPPQSYHQISERGPNQNDSVPPGPPLGYRQTLDQGHVVWNIGATLPQVSTQQPGLHTAPSAAPPPAPQNLPFPKKKPVPAQYTYSTINGATTGTKLFVLHPPSNHTIKPESNPISNGQRQWHDVHRDHITHRPIITGTTPIFHP
mmetsp:Transcript_27954/g.32231  ORF Transcript_27954/g.32231 Transcript_27954/m.32231 type:complete len:257 (-) Transcript_27954:1199-1969(-)